MGRDDGSVEYSLAEDRSEPASPYLMFPIYSGQNVKSLGKLIQLGPEFTEIFTADSEYSRSRFFLAGSSDTVGSRHRTSSLQKNQIRKSETSPRLVN